MENKQIDELKSKVDLIKKRLDKEEERKKYNIFYSMAFSLLALSLTLFYSNYLIEKSFSQVESGTIQIMNNYQIPILGELQTYFWIGAWLFLILSLIIIIVILIKKRSFQRLSSWLVIKLFNKSPPQ
jgi:hypothetical protein